MKKENIKKVVLAYSGGLDTSIIIPWLKENYNNCEVVAVSGDVGQGTELDGLEEKAKATGASKLYVLDLKKDFVENYIFPTLKFGAKYEDYLLGTSFARPCIAKALADIAIKEGADAICHGCTGKGNDQVRFELTLKALCPDMAIIAPWREWDIKSRDEEIDYAEAHHIPLKINRETNYSKDKNLWHLSHEGLDLECPANEPQYNKPGFLELGVSPEQAPDVPTYVTIHFEKGVPTAVDGKEMGAVELVEYLNKLGGANGIGLLDIVENRLVGMKSRGVYETPGGAILYKAIDVLETITLDKESSHFKAQLAQKYADIVYNGQWFSPLKEAVDAFLASTQRCVAGTVKLKFYKGSCTVVGRKSAYSLYDYALATYDKDDSFDHAAGDGQSVNLGYMTPEDQVAEVQKGYEAIEAATGAEASHVFRTPGGNYGEGVMRNVGPLISAEIGWNIDSQDWRKPGAAAIANQVKNAWPGAIVLMHDGGGDRSQTVEALKDALPYLKSQGYRFVTMDELLGYPLS